MRPLENKQYSENSFTNNNYLTLKVRLNFERNDSGRKPWRYQKHRHHSQFPSLSAENTRTPMDWGLGLGLAGLFLDHEQLCGNVTNRNKLYQPSQHLDRNKCLHKVILFQENPPKWQQQPVPEKQLKLRFILRTHRVAMCLMWKENVWRWRHSSHFAWECTT